jgi:ribosomal protein S18 acetylase RimI-like enzyme
MTDSSDRSADTRRGGSESGATGLRLRQYDPRDSEAVVCLDGWALRDVGTDPDDIPGNEDVRAIASTYLDAGGEFLVGVLSGPRQAVLGSDDSLDTPDAPERPDRLRTFDGWLVAAGGFLPSTDGYEDERTVSGAAELHRMRVAPPAQGRGYGWKLLDALESRAAAAGFDLLLATTARRQTAAVKLYRSAGYTEIERSRFEGYELVHFQRAVHDG